MTATLELTNSPETKDIIAALDIQFDNVMLTVFLYASRNNFSTSGTPWFLIFIILLLYLLAALNIYHSWAQVIVSFIPTNGKSIWEGFESSQIYGAVGLSGVASRGIAAYYTAFGPNAPPQALFLEKIVSWSVLYSSLILATLLWCTILIIYRIWRVGAAAGRMYVYQRLIEMLVESASLYSAMIVVMMVFQVCNEVAGEYIEALAVAMRGIIPTVLVGRVAAGHARPDDSWRERSTTSSLRFQNHSSSQNDSEMSAGSEGDTPSPRIRPDLEEGLEDQAELGMKDLTQNHDIYSHPTHPFGTSNSVHRFAV
ncbi:hypothetical protein ARMGADRAFT_1111865 [Armillaria gallica]|uniref:Uncharacterized protein n=1 Tax=Armillaria gallica TaxID=47427 RepID=A0A2H3D5G9_ARMGA|nr:hypothetical protein ARMGADRAFT_1111865 [Armillaria gallica]